MRTSGFLLLFLISLSTTKGLAQQFTNGKDLIMAMHKKYYEGPCRSYTFSQKNTHYRNDSVVGNSTWYEAIEFPDKFRIDFGERENKNYVIFKKDSVFNYKKGELVKKRADENVLLLLLGGMYYRPVEDVMKRLEKAEFKLNALSQQRWNDEEVYVIGAEKDDLFFNQVWISKKDFKVLRIIERLNAKEMMDMRFESHQPSCKGFVETRVSFRRNGTLEQVEEYYDIKESKEFLNDH